MRRLVTTAVLVVAAWAAAPASAFIYWTSQTGNVGRANLDGTGANPSFIQVSGATTYGVAVNGTSVYWINQSAGTIGRANLDGSGVNQSFITGTGYYTTGIAVNGGYVYWTNQSGPTVGVFRAAIDGSGLPTTVVSLPGTAAPDGPAVDGTNVYWADNHGEGNPNGLGSIMSCPIAGCMSPTTLVPSLNYPNGVAVTSTSLFWAEYGDGNLETSPLGGAPVTILPNTVSGPNDVAISGSQLYWTNLDGGSIGRSNLDGSAATQNFVANLSHPTELAIDAGALPPTTTIAVNPTAPNGSAGWYVSAVHLTVASSDNVYPVGQVRCVLDPPSVPASFAALPASCPFAGGGADVTSDGAHVVYAAAVDSQGNAGTPVSTTFKIDATAPSIACTGTPQFVLGSTGGAITAGVADTLSGPSAASVSAPPDATTAGAKSVALTGHDNAGNASTVTCAYRVRPPDLKPSPTMTWTFKPGRKSTSVTAMVVLNAPLRAKVRVLCSGRGCPFSSRTVKTKRAKRPAGTATADLHGLFRGRHLAVGAKLTVEISQANRIGKAFLFTIRAGKPPRSAINCLSPGSTVPGRGC